MMSDEEFLANLKNIDNKKLIQSLQNCGHDGYYNSLYYPIIEEIKRRLSSTSAEQEREKGKWQRRKDSDYWECSQCHAVLENDDLGMHNFYFCYHCGANMMNKSGYMNIEKVHYE